ncbi:hypothetical protein AB0478_17590 [Streptomyces sp. NPDC051917]|uniref:hypothetical protein n=1 Tax=Streptomyces sp. NPDC051917 TaxID=3154754 RepID=UPI00344C0352
MHKHRRLALATATTAALTGGGLLTFAASPATAVDSAKFAKADFNSDVATSAPGAHVSGQKDASQIVVPYRTATAGVSASGVPQSGAIFAD